MMSELYAIFATIGYLLMTLFSVVVIIWAITGAIVWIGLAMWAFSKRSNNSPVEYS